MIRAKLPDYRNNLWYDVASTPNYNGVANTHIQAFYLISVVQRGIGYDNTCHTHWLQARYWGCCASATDLDLDCLDGGGLLLSWELVRNRPTRCARDKTKHFSPIRTIDLVDNTINIVWQGITLILNFFIKFQTPRSPQHH